MWWCCGSRWRVQFVTFARAARLKDRLETPWIETEGEKRPAKEEYFDVAYTETDREEAQL